MSRPNLSFVQMMAVAIVLAGLAWGCGPSSQATRPGPGGPAPAPPRQDTAGPDRTGPDRTAPDRTAPADDGAEACAARLHEIAGGILLYYAAQQDFPADMAELAHLPGMNAADAFRCPVSRQRYVYHPDGVAVPGRAAWIVLHDPAPSHEGMRWAVMVDDPQPGMPLVTRVVALPESFFLQQLLR